MWLERRDNMLNKNRQTIIGRIVAFDTVLPEDVSFVNSKLATFAYDIDGKVYNSENTIQVPMTYDIGHSLEIAYDLDNPTKIYKKHLFVL